MNLIESGFRLNESCRRAKRITNFLNKDLADYPLPSLTKEQKKQVNSIWNGIHVDYRWFAFFNSFYERDWSPLFVPSNLHYGIVDMYYTNYKSCRVLEDKNLNNLLFHDVKQPLTIVRKMNGLYYGPDYESIDVKNLSTYFQPDSGYIIKPSIESGGGKKISVWKPNDEQSLADFVNSLHSFQSCVVQQFSSQHPNLASIHPNSLNTIRIMTFLREGKSKALSTIMRLGSGGSTIDNASQGGIFVGVNGDGRLKNIAYNDWGKAFPVHPTTKAIFSEHIIPGFGNLVELAEKLHNRFAQISRLISWDFGIDANGDPLLIEVNATLGGISFHQMCNGPLFGDDTEEMIKEVFTPRNKRLSKVL